MFSTRMSAFLLVMICCLCFAACSKSASNAAGSLPSDASPEDRICAAASTGDLATVKSLVESDPTIIDALDGSNRTPLHYAAGFGQNDVVKYLLDKGAALNIDDENGENPIDAAMQNEHRDTANIMINFSKKNSPPNEAPPQS